MTKISKDFFKSFSGKILLATQLLFFATLLNVPSANSEGLTGKEITGLWWTPKKDAKLEISDLQGTFSGKLVWIIEKDAEKLDIHNPDESKRNQKVMGLKILDGFKFSGDQWDGGSIYDPKNGKTYSCKMSLKKELGKPDVLKVRGFIGISLFGRTEEFTRVE